VTHVENDDRSRLVVDSISHTVVTASSPEEPFELPLQGRSDPTRLFQQRADNELITGPRGFFGELFRKLADGCRSYDELIPH
jgi:hypothetical protein